MAIADGGRHREGVSTLGRHPCAEVSAYDVSLADLIAEGISACCAR